MTPTEICRRLGFSLFLPFALLAPLLSAQNEFPPDLNTPFEIDTGWVSNTSGEPAVVISFPVMLENARSLRLYFSEIALSGSPYDVSI